VNAPPSAPSHANATARHPHADMVGLQRARNNTTTAAQSTKGAQTDALPAFCPMMQHRNPAENAPAPHRPQPTAAATQHNPQHNLNTTSTHPTTQPRQAIRPPLLRPPATDHSTVRCKCGHDCDALALLPRHSMRLWMGPPLSHAHGAQSSLVESLSSPRRERQLRVRVRAPEVV